MQWNVIRSLDAARQYLKSIEQRGMENHPFQTKSWRAKVTPPTHTHTFIHVYIVHYAGFKHYSEFDDINIYYINIIGYNLYNLDII